MPVTTLIVISDLHISSRWDPSTSRWLPHDGLHSGDALIHFLEHVATAAGSSPGQRRLLLLGDTFDFLHTRLPGLDESRFLPITTVQASKNKMTAILEAHPRVFQALANLVAAGVGLDILPGNHDLDLIRPEVRDLLFERILPSGSAEASIRFFPWIYYIPKVLYAEHGQQYHDINAFTTLLEPVNPRMISDFELPLGALYDSLLYQLKESSPGTSLGPKSGPFANPVTRLFNKPFTSLPLLLRFALACLEQLMYRSSRECKARRLAYRLNTIKNADRETGLTYPVLLDIDSHNALSNTRLFKRLVSKCMQQRESPKSHYLVKAAHNIQEIMTVHHKPVRYYAFGHSHHANIIELTTGARQPASYLNPGTWVTSDGERFPFIEVDWDQRNKHIQARLMHWNEGSRSTETSRSA